MICFHCGQKVDLAGDLYIDVVLRQQATLDVASPRIRYHASCFYEIAGLEFKGYFKVLKNSYDLTNEEVRLLHASQKIPAIKAIRTRTGMGLKEAKDMCDAYIKEHIP